MSSAVLYLIIKKKNELEAKIMFHTAISPWKRFIMYVNYINNYIATTFHDAFIVMLILYTV